MLFTIITSCYNSSATLRRTYNSLVDQTYKNFEWIVIDDGSPDNGLTKELIETLSNEAPFPIIKYCFEENHYGAKSYVKACQLSTGEYACILDHDDASLDLR